MLSATATRPSSPPAARCVTDAARIGLRAKPVFAALAELEAAAPSPPIGLVLGSGFEDRPKLIAALSRRYRLIGNGAETIARAKNPAGFFALLDTLGIAHPATQLAPPSDTGGWLSKRVGGSGGTHVVDAAAAERSPRRYYQRRHRRRAAFRARRGDQATACASSASAANGPSVRDRAPSATAAPLAPCTSQPRSMPACVTPPRRCAPRSGSSASSPSTSCSSATPRSSSR